MESQRCAHVQHLLSHPQSSPQALSRSILTAHRRSKLRRLSCSASFGSFSSFFHARLSSQCLPAFVQAPAQQGISLRKGVGSQVAAPPWWTRRFLGRRSPARAAQSKQSLRASGDDHVNHLVRIPWPVRNRNCIPFKRLEAVRLIMLTRHQSTPVAKHMISLCHLQPGVAHSP